MKKKSVVKKSAVKKRPVGRPPKKKKPGKPHNHNNDAGTNGKLHSKMMNGVKAMMARKKAIKQQSFLHTSYLEPVLPLKQRVFAEEYVVDLNATQAAIRAGYTASAAGMMGYKLTHKPEVKYFIDKLLREKSIRREITKDEIARQAAYLATFDRLDFVDERGRPITDPRLRNERARNVSTVDLEVTTDAEGNERVRQYIKMPNKAAGVDLAAKLLGAYAPTKEEVQHSLAGGIDWARLCSTDKAEKLPVEKQLEELQAEADEIIELPLVDIKEVAHQPEQEESHGNNSGASRG
jgi:phage terminase small subunit